MLQHGSALLSLFPTFLLAAQLAFKGPDTLDQRGLHLLKSMRKRGGNTGSVGTVPLFRGTREQFRFRSCSALWSGGGPHLPLAVYMLSHKCADVDALPYSPFCDAVVEGRVLDR